MIGQAISLFVTKKIEINILTSENMTNKTRPTKQGTRISEEHKTSSCLVIQRK
jgi:hypothetical protein